VRFVYVRTPISTVGELEFANQLRVPPLLESTTDDQGRQVFDPGFEAGRSEFLDGMTTETWGLNQPYLAPTLRSARGDDVLVNVTNGLEEATTLHWHGMHSRPPRTAGPTG
jgi:suppressor of ftsI